MNPSGSNRIGPSGGWSPISSTWRLRQPGRSYFSLVIPPPNVTGSLHMGHMFEHCDHRRAGALAAHVRRKLRCGFRAPITPGSRRRSWWRGNWPSEGLTRQRPGAREVRRARLEVEGRIRRQDRRADEAGRRELRLDPRARSRWNRGFPARCARRSCGCTKRA